MDSTNRIQPISTTHTTARQTPNNDFGTVLARTVGEAARGGMGVIGGLAGGSGVLSTAVAGVQRAVSVVSSGSSAVGTTGFASTGAGVAPVGGTIASVTGSTGGAPSTGKGESWDLLEAQRVLQSEGRSFNMQYLQLQNAMQAESREHNTISNIMKVRHDTAKAAINNIR